MVHVEEFEPALSSVSYPASRATVEAALRDHGASAVADAVATLERDSFDSAMDVVGCLARSDAIALHLDMPE